MINNAPRPLLSILAAFALAACGGTADNDAPDEVAAAGDTGLLTAEYLEGEWCFERYTAGNDVEEQQITYRFESDGTLLYQTDSDAAVEEEGSYELGQAGLRILPTFSAFPAMRAGTIDPDRLTLIGMGAELLWTRGPCG